MDKNKQPLCPLRWGSGDFALEEDCLCLGDRCAWWHRVDVRYNRHTESNECFEQCGVLTIAKELAHA